MKLLLIIALACAAPLIGQARVAGKYELTGVTSQRLADTDGDGKQELILVHKDGGVASLFRIGFDADNKQLYLSLFFRMIVV